jgi:hypothetical protein
MAGRSLGERPTFRLTRVTRIFQKRVFTETTPAARAGCRAGFFVARTQAAAAPGGFLVFAEKQGNTGDHSHAVSERRKRKSGRPAAQGTQSGNGSVGGARHRTRGREQRDAHRRLQKRAAIVSRLFFTMKIQTRTCGRDRAVIAPSADWLL